MMDREAVVQLLKKILADQPWLPGAACRGRGYELFDPIRGNSAQSQRQK
ncbi:MAG: hypothetical protein ACRDSH_22180 [Pseudonocardiaceae bacterium]